MRQQTVLAALVLVGWILIGPPIDPGPGPGKAIRFAGRAPINQWDHLSAHDTAASCEDARAALPPREGESLSSEVAASFMGYKVATRCVPAEHLYPPRAPMPGGKP